MTEIPTPRSQNEIFSDLQALARSAGSLHELSAIFYRDWVLTIDTNKGSVKDEPARRWSTDKLNNNELQLLLGLIVQCPDDRTYATVEPTSNFMVRADELLREFHDRVVADAAAVFNPYSRRFLENPNSLGMFAREAIYYGAQSFYLHQFIKFARQRYREDSTWLLQNIGISIRPIIDIAQFITKRITRQISNLGHLRKEGGVFSHGDMTNSLLVAKDELVKRFGGKANVFIRKFSTRAIDGNSGFTDPFSLNGVSTAPMIDIGDYLYVPNQYRLLESIYESPFYWMIGDATYSSVASDHRGRFLERTTAHILMTVFGSENVFINANFQGAKDQVGAEVDVLVRYGEYVLCVQAKSKRVTLRARAGDPEALRSDFKGAIQDPYRQALASCALVKNRQQCFDSTGNVISLPATPRVFPLVILSDAFPAATSLSHSLLERENGSPAPVIWNVGELDCIARILPTPIEMLFYLNCRGEAFDSVNSDSEFNYLGYHLRQKLVLPSDAQFMLIDRDFATVVDDYMIAADLGIDAERPRGVLERLAIPLISPLLSKLKSAPPELAGVVIDFYDFSSAALEDFSKNIRSLRAEVAEDGIKLKAFSILTRSGGLSYVVAPTMNSASQMAAAAIGRKNKYENKADRWYVILDSLDTNEPVDGLLPLVWQWCEDEEEHKLAQRAAAMFKTSKLAKIVGGGKAELD